jgi:hypothetical protein
MGHGGQRQQPVRDDRLQCQSHLHGMLQFSTLPMPIGGRRDGDPPADSPREKTSREIRLSALRARFGVGGLWCRSGLVSLPGADWRVPGGDVQWDGQCEFEWRGSGTGSDVCAAAGSTEPPRGEGVPGARPGHPAARLPRLPMSAQEKERPVRSTGLSRRDSWEGRVSTSSGLSCYPSCRPAA